ncbi:triose phosphate isomerase [Candidatus Hydrogenisulfobacillus filiaventi]|uniref:Triosephosphate isomerase n=1 Tax=Candidatus Hydrogenisulfobacillus filiaventi TaxID=2707344 RepID=A0A6F8ZIL1_9FIRM|nr:triose-phosphate isomerase [Bacillota bacterium]CAB1129719.1 triose phosphate isomerase [Candidatus Hydrogenisulfobacillus filiaventi]
MTGSQGGGRPAPRRPILIANWKMYKTLDQAEAYARDLTMRLQESGPDWVPEREVVVCPPDLYVVPLARLFAGSRVEVGAQNLELGREGALTGATSAYLLARAGARYVIVGHSERRRFFGETNELVGQKAAAAVAEGLIPIVCVGESAEERDAERTAEVVASQLAPVLEAVPEPELGRLIVAYEPVWAIGTGRVPEVEEADEVAAFIRAQVGVRSPHAAASVRVLYGGSVTEHNLAGFWQAPDIDGALVGGASLDVDRFFTMLGVPLS